MAHYKSLVENIDAQLKNTMLDAETRKQLTADRRALDESWAKFSGAILPPAPTADGFTVLGSRPAGK
jgi:hypothetical protein